MNTPQTAFLPVVPVTENKSETGVNHLGVLVGDPGADRIIAVSTSAVFRDQSLIQNFWGKDSSTLDSGFQGHLYTRPNDILVVRSPVCEGNIPEMIRSAIGVNYDIWNSLTGIRLASTESRIIIVSDHQADQKSLLPGHFIWRTGSLQDAAVSYCQDTGESFLAFVPDCRLEDLSFFHEKMNNEMAAWFQTASLMMDKNHAMELLQKQNIQCATTYPFNGAVDFDSRLREIPESGRYMFKPAGGAAGISLFPGNNRSGARIEQIARHIKTLLLDNKLPERFQIQEFLPGQPYGVSAGFDGKGGFEIFEIHQQNINNAGKFTGGRWTPAIEEEQMENVYSIYEQMAINGKNYLFGLFCLDIIDGKVIEVNPRLTAAAPIAHILRRREQIENHVQGNFEIRQIDLHTGVRISYESVRNGKLKKLIETFWQDEKVLVLPQGLDPFGTSRLIFINDNLEAEAQKRFLRKIE